MVVVQEPAQSLDWVLNKVTGTHLVPNSPSQVIAQSRSLKVYAVDPQAIIHQ